MSVYSTIHEKDSIMAEAGFKIDIPGGLSTKGRDWYPFVMTFNADGYKARGGLIEGMTILYNFPAFNLLSRTNTFYEPDSLYNSSFSFTFFSGEISLLSILPISTPISGRTKK